MENEYPAIIAPDPEADRTFRECVRLWFELWDWGDQLHAAYMTNAHKEWLQAQKVATRSKLNEYPEAIQKAAQRTAQELKRQERSNGNTV